MTTWGMPGATAPVVASGSSTSWVSERASWAHQKDRDKDRFVLFTCIESMISIAQRFTTRVANWNDGTMKEAPNPRDMLESERSFGGSGNATTCQISSLPSTRVTHRLLSLEEYDQVAA